MASNTLVQAANCGDPAESLPMKSADALSREHAAMLGALERLLRLVHQPNPTDSSRWDVKPGAHKSFGRLIDDVSRIVVIVNCTQEPAAHNTAQRDAT